MLRLLAIAGVVLVVVAAAAMTWVALDLPPPRLVLAHGLPPAGGPTGRRTEVEGVTFVEIGTGCFRMGSWFNCQRGDALGRVCQAFGLPWGKQPQGGGNETPVRWVEIREPYWIAETEVTNAEYERYDPKHERSEFSKDDDSPVVEVSWENAQAYCQWLAARSGLPVRLPSEAEWENACRAGSEGEYGFGDDEKRLTEYAWFAENSKGRAHTVKTKRANAWGLFDLHGNVWEWCEDTYHQDYKGSPEDARAWTEGGEVWGASPYRVGRGGGWDLAAAYCRSAVRVGWQPGVRWDDLGFRPACGPSDP